MKDSIKNKINNLAYQFTYQSIEHTGKNLGIDDHTVTLITHSSMHNDVLDTICH